MSAPDIDHAAEAERLAEEAKRFISGAQQGDTILALAQVYATLALVGEVRRVAEVLDDIDTQIRRYVP